MSNSIMNNLKLVCEKKLKEFTEENNSTKLELYSLIKKILNKKNPFEHLSFQTCINILLDLDYSEEDALTIYNKVLKDNM